MSAALDLQRERAAILAREIVSRAPAGSIAGIFAGGSLGRGEVWAAEIDGVTEVYSDIDLYVVANSSAAEHAIRAVTRDVTLPETNRVRFLRRADVGVYTREDLAAQPLRPGTVELDTHHLMLYGDDAVARS